MSLFMSQWTKILINFGLQSCSKRNLNKVTCVFIVLERVHDRFESLYKPFKVHLHWRRLRVYPAESLSHSLFQT
jgi:hypothetical protein